MPQPPAKGQATDAALAAVARALSVPRSSVRLVVGRTTRRKVIEVLSNDEQELTNRMQALLAVKE